ncbi:hypothetical protein LSUB1_G002481 [Lachnellula subtilissima]|uniref:Uncharacterized protein n=1 Tax=Lachnellula subtilissima TaxID=602034 RepID=A0A8H8RSP5_9HELO|nr:hypothetical protein LSUB1_G002481 [Lachnellula subtilissima]
MAPDLNSLPASRSSSSAMGRALSSSGESAALALRGQSPSPSPRSTSISLQATAAVNAGLQQEDSRAVPRSASNSAPRNRQPSYTGRRRSAVLMNLQLNDPNLPSPGEMITEGHAASYRTSSPHSMTGSPLIPSGDPHHNRNPSLGEIHQEIEQEQEAQVNRLLQMIRNQQQHLQQLQAASGQSSNPAVIDESTPTSERSLSFTNAPAPQPQSSTSTPRSPSAVVHPRTSFDVARADLAQRRSRTPSQTASPRIRSTSISGENSEPFSLAGRDESAFYQAETQMMVRENQMLRQRIRELERHVAELHANSSITHEPITPSHLLRSTSASEEQPPTPATADANTEIKIE